VAQLTCYGGVGEIGGNKILVTEGDFAFFFDFGIPFARRRLFFEEYLNPRTGAGLLDFLEMGLLPPLKGSYRSDLEVPQVWSRFMHHPHFRTLEVAAVLLSHAHLDHSGYISFLRPDIPVYATAMTAILAKAIQDSGKSDIEREVCYAIPRKWSPELGALQPIGHTKAEGAARQRPFRIMDGNTLSRDFLDFWHSKPGERPLSPGGVGPGEKLGPLPLRCFPLDHSIPGACALAVETSAGWLVYTGDIRFHGKNAALSHEFVKEAAALRPAVLLSEGTYWEREFSYSEETVLERVRAAVSSARGLVIADFAPRDIERLRLFLAVARENGRRLVILPEDAYLLDALSLLSPEVPNPEHELIFIFEQTRSRLNAWTRELKKRYSNKFLPPEEVHRRQEECILCFSFLDINELISVRPAEGGLYIYSSSEPHDEEGMLDIGRLHNWLEHFGIRPVGLPGKADGKVPPGEEGFHASGHASGPELLEMVLEIRPRIFIPVHTESRSYPLIAEKLKGTGIKVVFPQEGEAIPL